MLQVVMFENGRYGIQNQLTGILLSKKGHIYQYRSARRAARRMNRVSKRLNRIVNRFVNKQGVKC